MFWKPSSFLGMFEKAVTSCLFKTSITLFFFGNSDVHASLCISSLVFMNTAVNPGISTAVVLDIFSVKDFWR